MADRPLHGDIRVQDHFVGRIIDQAHGQRDDELSTLGLGDDAAPQAGADEVQLRLAHGTFQPQHQAVVEIPRVIESVLVADESAAKSAQLQQPMPIRAFAGQAGNLEPEHDAGPAHAHLGHESLESLPVGGRGAREALVAVDHLYLVELPAQGQGPLAQGVLAGGGLGVEGNLVQCRLAHIEIGSPRQVPGCHLLGSGGVHGSVSPAKLSAIRASAATMASSPRPGEGPGIRAGAGSSRQACIQAVIPWRISTASPRREPSGSPARARWRSCS